MILRTSSSLELIRMQARLSSIAFLDDVGFACLSYRETKVKNVFDVDFLPEESNLNP